jgi:metal-responsive CopG/Arc/MetJ family transcriptional regulator
MTESTKVAKTEMLIVRIDAELAEALDRLAFRRAKGKRSPVVRDAIRALVAAELKEETKEQAA